MYADCVCVYQCVCVCVSGIKLLLADLQARSALDK